MTTALEQAAEALRPFAEQAERFEPDDGDGHYEAWDFKPRIGDLRRAAAALARLTEQARVQPDIPKAVLDEVRGHIRGMTEEGATYDTPYFGWTCFHCGETFHTEAGARLHFGKPTDRRPACARVPPDRERLADDCEGCAMGCDDEYHAKTFREAAVALRLPADGWRTIESAPKVDPACPARGPLIYLGGAGWALEGWWTHMGFWATENDANEEDGYRRPPSDPTHWMPLPSPPEVKP